ncbi:MAG: PspC domain-containing protein [Bacteroidales bacterium]|nr:PspC domain-containing protein [Bacteroidales bacterium]MDE5956340.1 PspC domain-containing protein [Bacteroidales bacterium]MDE6148100.1 PspC domain-containing protein [Bacteroidales bacterium]
MKKTVNAAIGGCSFIIDEDAYAALETYLVKFRGALDNTSGSNEVMEELEMRIADLLKEKLRTREVVDITMTEQVIKQLGFPEGYTQEEYRESAKTRRDDYGPFYSRKLFRDPDDKKIAGVCSGLALFLNVDVVLIRVIFLLALICGSAGFWIYAVIWLVAPEARTAAEKCELRGIPATAENIRRFTSAK